MTLAPHEFIRRFLMHVLPKGFHRIRHGACPGPDPGACSPTAIVPPTSQRHASCSVLRPRVEPEEEKAPALNEPRVLPCPCPRCGGRMLVIEVFARGCEPRHRPTPAPIRIDTS